jgi:hypothetical protein
MHEALLRRFLHLLEIEPLTVSDQVVKLSQLNTVKYAVKRFRLPAIDSDSPRR